MIRAIRAVACAFVAAVNLGFAPAAASAATDVTATWLPAVNTYRATHGLPALISGNVAAATVVAQMADATPRHTGRWWYESCTICSAFGWTEAGPNIDTPQFRYQQAGGTGTAMFAIGRSDWSLVHNIDMFAAARIPILDPRAASFDAARNSAGDIVVIGVRIDPSLPFADPVPFVPTRVVPQTDVDATGNHVHRERQYPGVLVPSGFDGSVRLLEVRAGATRVVDDLWWIGPHDQIRSYAACALPCRRQELPHHWFFPELADSARWYEVGSSFAVAGNPDPPITEDTEPEGLAYGRSYVLQAGTSRTRFTTELPSGYTAGSWRFTKTSPARSRQLLRRLVASGPSQLRQLMDEVDQDTIVDVVPGACSGTPCGRVTIAWDRMQRDGHPLIRFELNPAFLDRPTARFHLYHELGHIVDLLELDDTARVAFGRAYRRGGHWRSCFRVTRDGDCTPLEEIWGQQFALWATGATRIPRDSIYHTPELVRGTAFARLLATHARLTSSTDVTGDWSAARKRAFGCGSRCRF